eukprot:10945653-Alexandrium_andersonii.AAC.1
MASPVALFPASSPSLARPKLVSHGPEGLRGASGRAHESTAPSSPGLAALSASASEESRGPTAP